MNQKMIQTMVSGLAIRERTLVLLAASTGLRQSELFGLKWGDLAPSSTRAEADLGALEPAFIGIKGPRPQGRLVVRSPEQLRLHPAIARLNPANSLVDFAQAESTSGLPISGPILITANGTVISGFRDWQAAFSERCPPVGLH